MKSNGIQHTCKIDTTNGSKISCGIGVSQDSVILEFHFQFGIVKSVKNQFLLT